MHIVIELNLPGSYLVCIFISFLFIAIIIFFTIIINMIVAIIITDSPPTTIIIIVIIIISKVRLRNTPTMVSYLHVMSLVR